MNPLALLNLGSGTTKFVVLLGTLFALSGTAVAVVHEHDKRVLAEVAAKQAALVAADQKAQADRTIAGLTAAYNQAEARARQAASLKEAIHAAPASSACSSSPAIRALVRGLRGAPGGSSDGAAPTPAGNGVGLPSAAPAAARGQ